MDQQPAVEPVVEADLVVELALLATDVFKRGDGRPGSGWKKLAVVLKGAGGVGGMAKVHADGALALGLKEGLYLGVKEGVEGCDFGAILGDFDEGHSDGGPGPTRGGKHLRDVRCVLTSFFNKLVADYADLVVDGLVGHFAEHPGRERVLQIGPVDPAEHDEQRSAASG